MKEIWVTQREGQAIEHILLPRAEYEAICAIVDAARAMCDASDGTAFRDAHDRVIEAVDALDEPDKKL